MATLYDVIGVKQDAIIGEISHAYHAQALRHHPEKGGDPVVFHRLFQAHAVLSHVHRRKQYDLELWHIHMFGRARRIRQSADEPSSRACIPCHGTGWSYLVQNLSPHFKAPHVRCAYCTD